MQDAIPSVASSYTPKEVLQRTILSALADQTLHGYEASARFSHCTTKLTDDLFEGALAGLWKVVQHYFSMTGGAPSPADFDELLSAIPTLSLDNRLHYSQLFTELSAESVSNARFKLAVERLRERCRDDAYGIALLNASRILTTGATIGGEHVVGFSDSWSHLQAALGLINLQMDDGAAAGDVADETHDVMAAYHRAASGVNMGVLTGFAELDSTTNGMQPGELWLLAGYTGEGKSKISYNMAYAAAYLQGKNVLFGTAEATREQVRRNLVVRHSHHEKFDHRGGLRYSDVKYGALAPTDQAVLEAVLADLRDSRSQGYGSVHLFNVPHRASPAYIRSILERQQRARPIDLIVIDYLGLMSSETKRQSRREELDDLLVATKRLATDANGGRGIPILSPWQISRQAWVDAQREAKYTKACLSDTSQAERSTDVVLAILKKEDAPNSLNTYVLKSRDSEEGLSFVLHTDYSTCLVSTDRSHADLLS